MTKLRRALLPLIVLVCSFATSASAQTDAQKAFTSVKNMPGTWEGKTSDGRSVEVNFKVISGGSAVMSEIVGEHNMISMFHLDGPNKFLLTHYCATGNQPRMLATISPDGKTLTFNFMDATNLSTPDAGHMNRMVLTLLDENHHTEEWVFADLGKEMKEVFELRRKL